MADDAESGDEDEEEEEFADDESFGEVDGLDGVYFALLFCPNLSDCAEEGDAHLVELSKLAEKDPEFYKYLQENDQELLDFDPNAEDAGDSDDEEAQAEAEMDDPMGETQTPILTKTILRNWQNSLLKVCPSSYRWKPLILVHSTVHCERFGSCSLLLDQRRT